MIFFHTQSQKLENETFFVIFKYFEKGLNSSASLRSPKKMKMQQWKLMKKNALFWIGCSLANYSLLMIYA